MHCPLRVLEFAGNLNLVANPVPPGSSANANAPGAGACGIAIADLDAGYPGKEILVGTLNGELLVFSQTQGVINSQPIFRTVLDGSLGAFHSIVVQDLHPVDEKPEVYAATSPGRQPKRRGCLHPDHGQRPDERCRRKHCIGS